jgi:hypothetical protein
LRWFEVVQIRGHIADDGVHHYQVSFARRLHAAGEVNAKTSSPSEGFIDLRRARGHGQSRLMLQVPKPTRAATLDETSPSYPGWRVVIACFTYRDVCLGFGFYGHGVFLAELLRPAAGRPRLSPARPHCII